MAMAHFPSMPQSSMVRFVQLPGRNVLVAGAVVTLVTALVMTSSSQLARLDRQSRQSKRQEIVGTVHYQGRPLARGRILYLCQLIEPEMEVLDAEAEIVDGHFHISKASGPMPGWFLIRVMAEDLPQPNRIARSIVTCRDYDSGPVRVPLGSDLFVRLKERKLNRFDIVIEPPAAPAVADVACF
jgi:hypothetical protein